MKKIIKLPLILITIITLLGCEVAKTTYAPNDSEDGLILKYSENNFTYDNFNKKKEDYYVIEVYNNQTIEYGYTTDGLEEKKISINKYNKIIKLAFSDEFISHFFPDYSNDDDDYELYKNISASEESESGIDSSIALYSTNDGSVLISGENPDDEYYEKLVKILKKYAK